MQQANKFFVIIIFVIPGLFFFSCQKESQENNVENPPSEQATPVQPTQPLADLADMANMTDQPADAPETAEQDDRPSMQLLPSGMSPQEPTQQETEANTAAEPQDRGPSSPPDQAFSLLWQTFRNMRKKYPLDIEMDNLQTSQHPALPMVESFLEALQESRFDVEFIDPESAFSLRIALEPILDQSVSIDAYRLGSFRLQNSQLHIPLRLYSEDKSAVGMLYATEIDNAWYIQDAAIEWDQLLYPEPLVRFTPAIHQWTGGP